MSNYDKLIDELVERAIEKRHMPLAELIESENLQEYIPGTMTILYGDELNNAIVPCRGFMILTRDRYDEEKKDFISEYAIYAEHDNDNMKPLYNAMNANATYKLVYVAEETFENMAFAIADAVEAIRETTEDDPIKIVSEMTDGDPEADLTEEDAAELIKEAKEKGYLVPQNLTPELFLSIYEDLKPEEDEVEE